MSFFQRQTTFSQDKPIVANVSNVSYSHSAQIRKASLSPSPDGKTVLQAGTFVARYYDSGEGKDLFRPLPRVELVADLADGVDTSFSVKNDYSQVLLAGDVLSVIEPHTSFLMVAGAGNAATITVDGRAVTFTTTEAALADVATETAAYFNDAPYVKDKYYFAADGSGNLHIFSRDGVSQYTGDTTAGAAFDSPGAIATVVLATPVGTVQQISTVDGSVVLAAAANAGLDLPAGTHLGVVSIKEIYGLVTYSHDFTAFRTTYDAALLTEGNVYQSALPYFDGSISSSLPSINFQVKF